MPDLIARFSGAYRFLSNFYPVQIEWEGIAYPSTEHAFNAGKTLDRMERLLIASAGTPGEAKARGRRVHLRPGWDEVVRYEVMAEVLELKFMPGTQLAERLLRTGDMELVEGNDWHDTHWGVCDCPRHQHTGDNHLGRLLMEHRTWLRRN